MAGSSSPGVLVFQRGVDGWGSQQPAAVLLDSGGALMNNGAVSGHVVAFALGSSGNGAVDVFVEPAGSWSGTMPESAKLRAPDGVALFDPSFAGSAIVAGGFTRARGAPETFVFPEPAGGWQGTVTDAAKLAGPAQHRRLAPASTHSALVFVGGRGGVFVYSEPRRGWTGTVSPSGLLQTSSDSAIFPAEVSGRTAVVGLNVFREPRRGNANPSLARRRAPVACGASHLLSATSKARRWTAACPQADPTCERWTFR